MCPWVNTTVSSGRSVQARSRSWFVSASSSWPVSTRTSASSVAKALTLPKAGMKAMPGATSSRSRVLVTGWTSPTDTSPRHSLSVRSRTESPMVATLFDPASTDPRRCVPSGGQAVALVGAGLRGLGRSLRPAPVPGGDELHQCSEPDGQGDAETGGQQRLVVEGAAADVAEHGGEAGPQQAGEHDRRGEAVERVGRAAGDERGRGAPAGDEAGDDQQRRATPVELLGGPGLEPGHFAPIFGGLGATPAGPAPDPVGQEVADHGPER